MSSATIDVQALQAPACHENMVKVGGYILGEFGNLIAGDPRSGCVPVDCLGCVLFMFLVCRVDSVGPEVNATRENKHRHIKYSLDFLSPIRTAFEAVDWLADLPQ